MADQNVAMLRLTANSGLLTVSRGSDLYVARRISGVPEQFSAVALEEFRERLLLQVQRSIDYYESAMGQAGCDLLMVACTQSWTGPVTEFLRDALSIPVRAVSDAISDEFSVELYNPQRGKIDWGSVTDDEMNALCASLPALGGALRPIIEAEAA